MSVSTPSTYITAVMCISGVIATPCKAYLTSYVLQCSPTSIGSFQKQNTGFPQAQAWWTVKRQCMAVDDCEQVGVYLGTTNGQLWASFDEGASWQGIAMDLPQIYSVEVVRLP